MTSPTQRDCLVKKDVFTVKVPWWARRKPFRQAIVWALHAALALWDVARLKAMSLQGKSPELYWRNRDLLRGSKFVVFATYPDGELAPCHARLLKIFERRGYTVVIASNLETAAQQIDNSIGKQRPQLYRRPFGRDFGCYRDVCLAIYDVQEQHSIQVERVVLLNDSFLSFQRAEEQIVDHLDSGNDQFCGLTENFEVGYHVGSFALAMGCKAFNHPNVRRFWTCYSPVSTRRHSIVKGEMGLTSMLRDAGFLPKILCDLTQLKRYLMNLELRQLQDHVSLLPPAFERMSGALLDEVIAWLDFPNSTAEASRQARGEALKSALVHNILSFVFSASPVHLGAAVIAAGATPILKKDVVWRLAVHPWDVVDILAMADPDSSEEERAMLYRLIMAKGHPYTLPLGRRLLFYWAMI